MRNAGSHFIDKINTISGHGVTVGVTSAWLSGLPRNLIEPIAFAGTIIWAMVALVLATWGRCFRHLVSWRWRDIVSSQMFNPLQLSPPCRDEPLFPRRTRRGVGIFRASFSRPATRGSAKALPNKGSLFSESIELRDVSFKYEGAERPTLQGINIRIGKGESIGFVGQTGSGKSTLINLLLGLYVPTGGKYLRTASLWESLSLPHGTHG